MAATRPAIVPLPSADLLFDLGCAELPEPELELPAFLQAVRDAQKSLPAVYNPLTNSMAPWIDVWKLERQCKRKGAGGGAGGCVVS